MLFDSPAMTHARHFDFLFERLAVICVATSTDFRRHRKFSELLSHFKIYFKRGPSLTYMMDDICQISKVKTTQ